MKPTVANLNYTERRRIEREDVRISGFGGDGAGYFILEKLEIDQFGFDPLSRVVIECFTGKIGFQRFDHGTIADLESNRSVRHSFQAVELRNATFRVKVVAASGGIKGRILADADGIPVEFGGRPASLLAVEPASIGDLVWAIDFPEDAGPKLQINDRVPDYQQVVRDNEFRAIVIPQVVEQIALWVAARMNEGEIDIAVKKWKKVFANLGFNFDKADTSTLESRHELAEKVSRDFAKRNRLFDMYIAALDRRD